jgi:hypothetical protein
MHRRRSCRSPISLSNRKADQVRLAPQAVDKQFATSPIGGGGAEIVLDIGFEGRLVALEGEQVVGLMDDEILSAIPTWQPMASIVTSAPLSWPASASSSRRSGMAVISLVFSER